MAEPLSILLATLIGLVSPTGLVLDRVAESTLRKQLVSAEQLQVRIDNAPNHQIIQGRVDRIRIAGKGLVPIQEFRIDTFELDSDRLDLGSVDRISPQRLKLAQPIQTGVRVVLKPEDINRALQSPLITNRLRNLGVRAFLRQSRQIERYDFINPQITFLANGFVRLQVELKEQGYPDTLKITAEAKPILSAGRILKVQDLKVLANGQPAPDPIVRTITRGIAERFDLAQLEKSGITARILTFKIEPSKLEVAAFIQRRPR